jgi:hypothetical protein
MTREEAVIENEIKFKGLTGPRITPERIDQQIVREDYYVFPGTVLTVCMLELENGFQVVGHSAPVSKENFDEALGKKIAREKAREQIWSLEGYLLKTMLGRKGAA